MASFWSLLAFSLNLWLGASSHAFCSWCENAPSRSWNWWFGWGDCECHEGWSGKCCDEWSVSNWTQKVADWSTGKSCEAQPKNACRQHSEATQPEQIEHTQTWQYQPADDASTQSACEAKGCMWVECFEASGNGLPYSTGDPHVMCTNCEGPWKDKCEWKHYEPGFLAFAGPGEHCGFTFPVCPASEAKHCFCGDAATKVKEGWCNNGEGMSTFCPNAMAHGDGRNQACSWNGWTVSPQVSGGGDATCKAWGLA